MKIHERFPTVHLCAADLNGKDAKVTIKSIKSGEVTNEKGETSKCYLLEFDNAKKSMVLNKTNWKLIATHYGQDDDAWLGKEITLYPTKCQSFGETKDCIRVRGKKGGLK